MQERIIDISFSDGLRITPLPPEPTSLLASPETADQDGKKQDEHDGQTIDIYLESMASCVGHCTIRFCEAQRLSTKGITIRATCAFSSTGFRVERVRYAITLPPNFPGKYKEELFRTIDQCALPDRNISKRQCAVLAKSKN